MKKYLLFIILLIGENTYGQAGYCNMNLASVPDTINCQDSAFLSVQFSASLSCTTYGTPMNQNNYLSTNYYICSNLKASAGCGTGPKLVVAVLDSLTLQAWSNSNLNFGQLNQYPGPCLNHPDNIFQFSFNDSVQVDSAVSMLTNKIPVGDYILAYSFEHFDYSLVDTPLVVAFRNLGFNSFDTIKNVPFIYFVQKGKPNTALQKVGISSTDIITLNATITYSYPLPNMIYSWTPCNSLDSCSVRSPIAKPTATTVYHLSATDTVTHFTLVDSITVGNNCASAFKDYISDNTISIYPNPATNQLTIYTSSFHPNEATTVSIINVLGRDVSTPLNVRWSLSEVEVDVSKLAAGLYFLQLKTESGSLVRKFVKE